MNFDQDDVLFGLDGDPFACASPMGGGNGYDDPSYHLGDPVDEFAGLQYDNSLAVPMDDQYPNDMQGSEFQTLQPPVSSAYDMDMGGHSQSSMGMGGYSNGGTNEGLLYEQATTITNGDHHMMGGEQHYGMPGTSFGSYQPSPLDADHHSSPSVSRQHSRPASRTPAQKGPGLVQQLNAPSTSSYSNSPAPAPPPAKAPPAKKSAPRAAPNGQRGKKNTQNQNTIGAVLSKANKQVSATPSAAQTNTGSIRLSPEEMGRVATLSMEIEQLQKQDNAHSRARVQELTEQRAQIFINALASQNGSVPAAALAQPAAPPARPRVSHKKQQPPPATSPVYAPQGASSSAMMYAPDAYAAVPGPSHGYTVSPAPQPMQQRGGTVYKVNAAPPPQQPGPQHAGPLRLPGPGPGPGMIAGGPGPASGAPPPIFLQQQMQHGQPPPQMMMTSSSMPTLTTPPSVVLGGGRKGGPGSRTMMVGKQPAVLQQQLQQAHPPGTTVRAALKQGSLHLLQQQHAQQQLQLQQQTNNLQQHQQQMLQQPTLHHAPPQQQQHHHRGSPMPSTSSSAPQLQQPQPLLQLSLPVGQQQQRQMRMEDNRMQQEYRPTAAQTARRIEEKRLARQRKLQNAFDIMSAQLLQPETEVPFAGVDDIFRRLMPYHLLFEHDMDPNLEEEFDLQFARSMVDADEKKRVIVEKMRRIAINEAVAKKDEECNLLLFLDAEWERGRLEEERMIAQENPDSLRPIARATALSLSTHQGLPPPSERIKQLVKPEGAMPLSSSLYEYHPFVERRRVPTPPPPGPLHGLEESEVEEDTEDEKESAASAAHAAGPSSAFSRAPIIKREPITKRSDSSEDEDEASPEMGWPADDLPPTVPQRPTVSHHHRPATVLHHPPTVPDRVVIKQEVASPRPAAAAAGKVQPAQPVKQELTSPVRTTVPSKSTVRMPEAIPVPLAKRNRMMEERMKEEERRKKVEERERGAAEERRKREEERKERERKGREEEKERRKREEEAVEEQKKVIMPLKIKFKLAAREEEKKEEEKLNEEERENREKKSKKKRKKEKRRAEEDEDEERERKRRKKEKKERERQAAAVAAAAETVVPPAAVAAAPPPAASAATPAIPKLKIKFGGGGGGATPAAAPAAAAAAATPRPPVLPAAAPALPATAPAQPVQQQQPSPAAPPPAVPRLKIKLGGPPTAVRPPTSPAKEERKREKEEKRKENGHRERSKERHHHHHKRKEHSHKEHRSSEQRHHEQQAAAAAAAPAAQPKPAAASQPPPVPSVKISMTLPRAPASQPAASMSAANHAAAAPPVQQLQQQQLQHFGLQQMAMNSHHQPPSSLFRPSVISPLQQSPLLQPMLGLPLQHLQQQQLLLPQPVMPTVKPPILGLDRLPPGPEEKSPTRIDFSDSEGEDDERSNALKQSAAAITRMVGHAPTLLPQHHHRLPQLQQVPPSASFPWNNHQYQ